MTPKKPSKGKKPAQPETGDDFIATVKIMANTPPISNQELTKKDKKHKK